MFHSQFPTTPPRTAESLQDRHRTQPRRRERRGCRGFRLRAPRRRVGCCRSTRLPISRLQPTDPDTRCTSVTCTPRFSCRSDSQFAILSFQSPVREQPNRFGIGIALGLEDASGEGVGGVPFEHRDGALNDDRAVVVFVRRMGTLARLAVCFLRCVSKDKDRTAGPARVPILQFTSSI